MGDIYSPQRGHITLAVPIFAPYILAHYDEARATSDTELLSLSAMHTNGAAAIAPRLLRALTPLTLTLNDGSRSDTPSRSRE